MRPIFLFFLFLFPIASNLMAQEEFSSVLTAIRTSETIIVDGHAGEQSWKRAKGLNVKVSDGSIGKITVVMKSLYDQENIYFLLTWPDASKDVVKKQWIFNSIEKRWVHAKKYNIRKDQVKLDEDRLSIIWNIDDSIKHFNTAACAVLCHGDRMHTNGSNEKADIWHWKAARTNPLSYTDDKWLDNKIERGYSHDKKEAAHHGDRRDKSKGIAGMGGNYIENSQQIIINNESVKAPLYWKPGADGEEATYITQDDIITGEAVKINDPLLTDMEKPIPGYLLFRPAGSRGDIDSKGIWKDGVWTLEMKRELLNGNDDDVQFDIRKLYRFGIAVMDNTGGFEAYDMGHSFDLGARTLEFGGTGSEEITTMALIRDYLETALSYTKKSDLGLARSEVNMAMAVFNTIQRSIADMDPTRYLDIKASFTIAKRNPNSKNLVALISKIDSAVLLIQGKEAPTVASWIQKTLVLWGKIQIYVFFALGMTALFPVYKSTVIRRRAEFKTMGTFLFMMLTPVVLESIGRLGMFFKIVSLQKFSFMTSEYATLLWAFLMAAAMFIGKIGFTEIDKALNILKKQKEKLEELSITDELTKLYNRRYFNKRLAESFSLSIRYNYPLSFMMVDIDHFKSINDSYGHQCGDLVLAEVAGVLKHTIRAKVDIPARLGGEEFGVVMFNTELHGAVNYAERLRVEIENRQFSCSDDRKIKVTVSIGIAQFPSPEITEEECLIAEADKALYKAKLAGRNCYRTFKDN